MPEKGSQPVSAGLPTTRSLPLASFVLLAASGALFVQSAFLLVLDSNLALKWNLVLQFALLVSLTVWSKSRTGSYLNPIMLFVAAIYFWHSTFLTGYIFSLSPLFAYTGNTFTYGQEYLGAATAAVSLCMAAACFGAFAAYAQSSPSRITAAPETGPLVSPMIAWGIFIACAAITMFYLTSEGGRSFESGYFAQYVRTEPETPIYRLFSSTKFFGVLAILLVFQSARTPVERLAAIGATLALIFTYLLFGSRSMPFVYGLTLLVSIDYFIKRIPLWALAVVAAAGSAISFIVAETRAIGIGWQIFDFRSTTSSLNLLAILWDGGTVIKTVLRTMAFSAQTGLEWGKTFFDAALSVVPTPLLSAFHISREIMRPSVWLVENSGDLITGSGLGYSLVAESYLNFGMLGFTLFLGIGWLLASQYRKGTTQASSLAHVIALNMGVLLALHMRNDVDTYFRVLFWSYVIVAVVRRLSRPRSHSTGFDQESHEARAFAPPRLHALQGNLTSQRPI